MERKSISNVDKAARLLLNELQGMSLEISEVDRESFFASRNIDVWMQRFIKRLRHLYLVAFNDE